MGREFEGVECFVELDKTISVFKILVGKMKEYDRAKFLKKDPKPWNGIRVGYLFVLGRGRQI